MLRNPSPPAPPPPSDPAVRLFGWYGVAAAGVTALAGTAPAGAQIVRTDVDPDVTLSDSTFAVDFDADGDPELVITESPTAHYIAGFADGADGGGPDVQTAIVALSVDGYQYFLPLSAGQSISAGLAATTAAFPYGPTFTFYDADPAGWVGTGDRYAGVEFRLDDGTTHFGWVLLEMPEPGAVTIKEFAYEVTPDTPIQAGATGTPTEAGASGVAGTHALSNVYPNPSRGSARFTLAVAQTQTVRVEVFDALGRRVATLQDGALAAGSEHRFAIDGAALPGGAYVIRVTGETFSDVRTVTLTR